MRFFGYIVAVCLGLLPGGVLAQVQIMPASKIRLIESHLPRIEPGLVRDVIEDPTGVWYDIESMGVAYQIGTTISADQEFAQTGMIGVANAFFNVSGEFPDNRKPNGFGGNLNAMDSGSFPWSPKPGGTKSSSNVESVKRFWLPKKDDGSPWPVVWFKTELEGVFNPEPTVTGFDWTFPIGTVFLEFIFVNDAASQQHYVAEIRARIREEDHWDVEIMKPFRNADDLRKAIVDARPRWRESPELVAFVSHLQNNRTVKTASLSDNTPGNRVFGTRPGDAFKATAKFDPLPPLDRKLVAELLDTTEFKKSVGFEWKPGAVAPTTSSAFHIVPEDYDGAFVGFDSIGCANCHRSTQISARRHNPQSGKYGWARGNRGGILSWQPFALQSLTNFANPTPQMRPEFVNAGMLERFSKAKHPESVYRRLDGPIRGSKR